MTMIIGGIAGISLVVGGGVMNIMLVRSVRAKLGYVKLEQRVVKFYYSF